MQYAWFLHGEVSSVGSRVRIARDKCRGMAGVDTSRTRIDARVIPRFERDSAGGYLQAPVMPSQRLLRLFAKFATRRLTRPPSHAVFGRMGSESVPMDQLMAAVRLGAFLKRKLWQGLAILRLAASVYVPGLARAPLSCT